MQFLVLRNIEVLRVDVKWDHIFVDQVQTYQIVQSFDF